MGFCQTKSWWFTVVHLSIQRQGSWEAQPALCQLEEPLALQRRLSCSEGGIALLSRAALAWGAWAFLWAHGHTSWDGAWRSVSRSRRGRLLVPKATPELAQRHQHLCARPPLGRSSRNSPPPPPSTSSHLLLFPLAVVS